MAQDSSSVSIGYVSYWCHAFYLLLLSFYPVLFNLLTLLGMFFLIPFFPFYFFMFLLQIIANGSFRSMATRTFSLLDKVYSSSCFNDCKNISISIPSFPMTCTSLFNLSFYFSEAIWMYDLDWEFDTSWVLYVNLWAFVILSTKFDSNFMSLLLYEWNLLW